MNSSDVELLKLSLDPEGFLRELGARNITVRGDEIIHSCILPFGLHANGDSSPAASLNAEKLLLNCFVCGGGDLIWFVENVLNVGSSEARKFLMGRVNTSVISGEHFIQLLEKEWKTKDAVPLVLPRYSEALIKPWLCFTKYLDERGINRDVQKKMRTGINRHNIDEYQGQELEQPRLTIPHFFKEKLVGWSMRILDERQAGPKYKHSHRFPKEWTLYNYDNVQSYDSVVVVESPMSVLYMMSNGFENVVATFGAQMNYGQGRLLTPFKEVIIFPDGDSTGFTALNRNINLLWKMPVRGLFVVDHGDLSHKDYDGKDPANFAREELEALINNRELAASWSDV